MIFFLKLTKKYYLQSLKNIKNCKSWTQNFIQLKINFKFNYDLNIFDPLPSIEKVSLNDIDLVKIARKLRLRKQNPVVYIQSTSKGLFI